MKKLMLASAIILAATGFGVAAENHGGKHTGGHAIMHEAGPHADSHAGHGERFNPGYRGPRGEPYIYEGAPANDPCWMWVGPLWVNTCQ